MIYLSTMTRYLLGFTFTLLAHLTWALEPNSDNDFQPITPRTDAFELGRGMSFPKGSEDIIVSIPCIIQVDRWSDVRGKLCIVNESHMIPYQRRVYAAISRAKMRAARVNGKVEGAVYRFTAVFQRKAGEETISLFPNHFLNYEQFGADYVAPQLISERNRVYSCRRADMILKVTVSREGIPTNPTFFRGDQHREKCLNDAKRAVAKSRYIPGMVEGVPTAMDQLVWVRVQ